jgi:hypothetical protein
VGASVQSDAHPVLRGGGRRRFRNNFIVIRVIHFVQVMNVVGGNSSVNIATCYGLDGPRGSNPGGRFFASFQTGPGALLASYVMDTGSFPGVKRPGLALT